MPSREPRIIADAPEGRAGAALVAASGRSGALGVLNLGRLDDPASWLDLFARLQKTPGHRFGVRVDPDQLSPSWLDQDLPAPGVVIVVERPGIDLADSADRIHRSKRSAWAEVFSRESAVMAAEAGFDGLIVAGHEAGGPISDESAFILLQAVLERIEIPVFVRGGIGPHVAAGCIASGASGVVLDGALLLAKESPLAGSTRERIARWDGSETLALGFASGSRVRVHAPPGSPVLEALKSARGSLEAWIEAVSDHVGWGPGQAWPVGQDAAFAGELARRHVTTGGIIQSVERAIDRGLAEARATRPLAEGSAMARSLRTRYPILQGPMTRVSDVVAFAGAVAGGGALPFLALAMLRGLEVARLLKEASQSLVGQSWGVGVLGFVSPELRAEQIAAILEAKPPFALIAGGRPDQARELDQAGITTFLHVPSPGLLGQFLREGSRRFVLEGRECGGHVGPRSSFVLWEQAIGVLLASIDSGTPADELHVVFAGGIHDDRSAALVSAMASPLASKGVRVGVLIGTAYLFTREVVETRAIVERFQAEAIRCERTVLLETGPGHEVRVSPSPFVETFEAERARLIADGRSPESVREALETLNAGRLRLAAKGVERSEGAGSPLVAMAENDQFDRGIYMLGQVATLRDDVTTIAELHASIARADQVETLAEPDSTLQNVSRPSDVAIVGMSAILPGAGDVQTFWEHTLEGFDAITEIPADRWDWRLYYDADPKAPDKIVSKWGGFVPDVPFDPLRYGMPPSSLPSIEPVQLLLLEATRAAIEDAGYAERPFARERTAVVLGMGGGAAQLAMGYAFRSYLPMLDTVKPGGGSEALKACEGLLPEWTEDSFPGFLLNVAAGRVANRFDLGGANYTVDAACGSSLAAAALAVRELETGSADVVILGGADTVQNPFTYLAFSKTQAFSPRGHCRPFDASADGIVISEGVAVVVLKRLADAERDGDRIYSVIKGIGASSDGRARGLTAPSTDGQVRAVKRAYAKANVDPKTVGYVEAHGTGTAVGDVVEINALSGVYRESGVESGSVSIGSVKSMIGHTKCAAGLAGLINASLALHHQILPPTIGVETVNPKADLRDGPFHVGTRKRPWIHPDRDLPRRAGVSAFGFGGTNFHAVLEAYEGNFEPTAPVRDWPAELFAWRSPEPTRLLESIERLEKSLRDGARPALRDLARAVNHANPASTDRSASLAIVATSVEDLGAKLRTAIESIRSGKSQIEDPRGLFYEESPSHHGQKVAFLFPGQGSQSPGMLADLTMTFPEVRQALDAFDASLKADARPTVGPLIHPASIEGPDHDRSAASLRSTDVAQPALGAASVGLLRLLASLGVKADVFAGHSFGELVALHASGAVSIEDLAILAQERGRLMLQSLGEQPGAMAAIAAGPAEVSALLKRVEGAEIVNENGPRQSVIAGLSDAVERAIELAHQAGYRAQRLAVAGAFHTVKVARAARGLTDAMTFRLKASPDRPIYSNLDASIHPSDLGSIAERLGRHVASPVRFAPMIEAMHRDGARVFVEVGPGSVLAPLVDSILEGMPHRAIALDHAARPGLPTLLIALARLIVAGVPVRLERLSVGRSDRQLDLAHLPQGDGLPTASPTTWIVNGSRVRPIGQPEPRRLGQGPALPILPEVTPTVSQPISRNGSTYGHPPQINGNGNGKAAAPPTLARAVAPSPTDDRVLASFQETMRSFLEVQRSTMLAYLAGRPSPASSPVPIQGPAPEPPIEAIAPRPRMVIPPRPEPAPIKPSPPQAPVSKVLVEESFGRDRVVSSLVEIVRDRTGYPAEMLGLDLDIEADLGIDSIKRVEILGTLRESVPGLNGSTDSSTMDALSRARTLGAIVDRVVEISHRKNATTPTLAEKPRVATRPETVTNPVRRMVIEVVSAPLAVEHDGLVPGGVVVLTDDGRGVARAISRDLESKGHSVVLAGSGEVDFSSPSSVEGLLDLARSSGDITAIVHALPLRQASQTGLDPAAWASRIGPELKGLFLLAKGAADDLVRASTRGGGALIAATSMGGTFATGATTADFFPGHGGVAGLVKTLAREWPGVRTRVIDFDGSLPPDWIGSRLVDELRAAEGWSEIGYAGDRRIRLQAKLSPLLSNQQSLIELKPGEPIVVTGGARGITATVAAELARRWRPTLLLLGRSPLPMGREDVETASIESPAELKSALHAKLRREGRAVSPGELEQNFQAIRQAREIRANLQSLRETGSTVEYVAVNVRDIEALSRVLDGWRRKFGEPVGLIHGAGVIKDKLIRDKTVETFDRVLGTKLDGALNLARLLKPDALRFAALFSSIAGRFGNMGQSDYAAANDVLNKLAIWLDRRWPGRVVSMNWGPWSGVGMVSELEEHLGGRGLGMIPPEIGRSLLFDELRLGRKGDVEVIAAGDLGTLDRPIERHSLAEVTR